MRAPLLLTVLLLLAVAHFLVVGLPAHRQAARALADLQQREQHFADLEQRLPAVSYADSESLAAATAKLAALDRERLAALLDASLSPAEGSFAEALAGAPLAPLDPLRDALVAQAQSGPLASRTLAALLRAVKSSKVAVLSTLELERGGTARPVPAVDGLSGVDASLTVIGGLHDALSLLEALAPGGGEPVLLVRQATLQRVAPGSWDLETAGPPVRLSVAATVLFADREPTPR